MKTKEELNAMPVELNEKDMEQVSGGDELAPHIEGPNFSIEEPGFEDPGIEYNIIPSRPEF